MTAPVLMFMNMKGGVGKTTLAVEISRTLAYEYSKNVLLIDYDPQANASFAFLDSDDFYAALTEGKSIAHCLMPQADENDPFEVIGTRPPVSVDHADYAVNVRDANEADDPARTRGKVDLIPGNIQLMRLALNQLSGRVDSFLLARWCGLINSASAHYDCIVVDCHPSGSFFTKSALLTSDAAVIPVTSDHFAATGLRMMRRHMEMWEPAGGAREFLVVFNNVNNSWNETVESEIRSNDRFANHCLPSRIPYSELLRNLPSRRQTVAEQQVPYHYQMEAVVKTVTNEMVAYLKGQSVFDASWSES